MKKLLAIVGTLLILMLPVSGSGRACSEKDASAEQSRTAWWAAPHGRAH